MVCLQAAFEHLFYQARQLLDLHSVPATPIALVPGAMVSETVGCMQGSLGLTSSSAVERGCLSSQAHRLLLPQPLCKQRMCNQHISGMGCAGTSYHMVATPAAPACRSLTPGCQAPSMALVTL
jgi:hypothetical protein